jgi:hypothetical protein
VRIQAAVAEAKSQQFVIEEFEFGDPIVRRVSRNSLLISLRQTEEAVGSPIADVVRSAGVRASAEQVRSVPAPLSNKSPAFTRVH